jgi:XTP/dITP diphosphohydrolase
VNRLLDTLRALRAPDGCPWDRAQTHESLRPHLIEEAAEAVDALASGIDADVVEELGDVLLHVGFHAVIAEEDGRWSYADVERALVEKLVRRHPHVFGDATADDPKAVEATWARIKAEERGGDTAHPALRVPRALPALARAAALARALGASDAVPAERDAAAPDARAEDDPAALADALWSLAARAARAGLDPETLLRDRTEAALQDALADAAR